MAGVDLRDAWGVQQLVSQAPEGPFVQEKSGEFLNLEQAVVELQVGVPAFFGHWVGKEA